MPKRTLENILNNATPKELRQTINQLEGEHKYREAFLRNLPYMSEASYQQLRRRAPAWVSPSVPANNTISEERQQHVNRLTALQMAVLTDGRYHNLEAPPSLYNETRQRVLRNKVKNTASWDVYDIMTQIKANLSQGTRPYTGLSIQQLCDLLRRNVRASEEVGRSILSWLNEEQLVHLVQGLTARYPNFLLFCIKHVTYEAYRVWDNLPNINTKLTGRGNLVSNNDARWVARDPDRVRLALKAIGLDGYGGYDGRKRFIKACPVDAAIRRTLATSLTDKVLIEMARTKL